MKKTNEELKEVKKEVAPKKATKTVAKKTPTKKATTKKVTEEKKPAVKKTSTKTTVKKATTTAKAKTTATKSTTKKATTTKKASAEKKPAVKKTATKTTAKKATTTAKAKTTATKSSAKKATTTKKATTKKVTEEKKPVVKKTSTKTTAKKATTTKKTTAKKSETIKSENSTLIKPTASKKVVKRTTKAASIDVSEPALPETLKEVIRDNSGVIPAEYYDLPYRYNETTIKILAQSPHSLFLYWDVSDADRQNFIDKYGESFFYDTKPVLLVHNKTQNYSFEVEVDDFTNSWYLRTPTSDCVFDIELARKDISSSNKYKFEANDDRLHITESNMLESPNDHILIESLDQPIMFKNVKTNKMEEEVITNPEALKAYYKDFEIKNEVYNNPSSNFRI